MSCAGGLRILRCVFARTLLVAVAVPIISLAQEPAASRAVAPAAALLTVPPLTPVIVRIEETISSNKNKPGDKFRMTVAEDVRVGNAIVIPAGSAGEGEVIHAARSGAGGKAGELIVAARYVQVGDVSVRLRSFTVGVAGKDQTDNTLAASFLIGPFAMFVHGGVITVPRDTLGTAKTATEFRLPAVAELTPPPQAQPQSSPQREE